VVLVYYEALRHHDAAQALGCSVGTVKRQMFRALRKLAALLPDMQQGAG
jgi:DNA-directed RNA polymerase specialized sigma24 family protein